MFDVFCSWWHRREHPKLAAFYQLQETLKKRNKYCHDLQISGNLFNYEIYCIQNGMNHWDCCSISFMYHIAFNPNMTFTADYKIREKKRNHFIRSSWWQVRSAVPLHSQSVWYYDQMTKYLLFIHEQTLDCYSLEDFFSTHIVINLYPSIPEVVRAKLAEWNSLLTRKKRSPSVFKKYADYLHLISNRVLSVSTLRRGRYDWMQDIWNAASYVTHGPSNGDIRPAPEPVRNMATPARAISS